MLTAGTVSASADQPRGSDSLDSIVSVVPDILDSAADVPTGIEGTAAISSTVAQTHVTIPVEPELGIGLRTGPKSVSIGLPFASEAKHASVEQNGVVSFDNNNGSVTVPVVKTDGGVQINTVIAGPDAPQRYEYPLALPAGSTVVEKDGGILIFNAAGESLGTFLAPWAFDAKGAAVATHYEVNGTTLTQVVEHTTANSFPVVADPSYYPPVAFYYSRSDVEYMWGVLQNLNNACHWIPLPYLASVACTAPAALVDAISSAHYQSKRVKALYYECTSARYCDYYTYSVIS